MRLLKGLEARRVLPSCALPLKLLILAAVVTNLQSIRLLSQTSSLYTSIHGLHCNTTNIGVFSDNSCQERCDEVRECVAYVVTSENRCELHNGCPMVSGEATVVAHIKEISSTLSKESASTITEGSDGFHRKGGSHLICLNILAEYVGSEECTRSCNGDEQCEAYATNGHNCLTFRACNDQLTMHAITEGYKLTVKERTFNSSVLEKVAFVKSGESGSGDTPEGYQRNSGKTCNTASMSTHTDGSCEERCNDDDECEAYVEFSNRCKLYASCPLTDADSEEDVAFVKSGESGSGDTPEGYQRNSGKTCNTASMSTHTDGSCEERCSDDDECEAYVEFSNRCKLYASCPLTDADSEEDVAFVKS